MLEYQTNKLIWDYNIPQSIDYITTVNNDCEICKNTEVKNWCAPYIASNVPYDQIIQILEKFFGFITAPEIIENHKKHIKSSIVTDSELQVKIKEQMKLIESDIPKQIDEKIALESLIRGLYGRKLMLEELDDYGKEYAIIAQQLHKALELKLKMKDELKEPSERQTLKDVIKLFEVAKDVKSSEPTITAGKVWIRDGTRESIQHFVRIGEDRYQKSSGIGISHTN